MAVALGLMAAGGFYLHVYALWTDPVVETQVVSGVVTGWARRETKYRNTSIVAISTSLDDGRQIIIVQQMPDILVAGAAEIEERLHRSGQLSFRWVRSKPK